MLSDIFLGYLLERISGAGDYSGSGRRGFNYSASPSCCWHRTYELSAGGYYFV